MKKDKKTSNRKMLSFNILSQYRNEIYGLCILWIMLFHGYLSDVYYFENVPVLKYFGLYLEYGNMGVEVFLLLSGICLYFSYIKNPSPIRFIKKRLARLFPPVIVISGSYWMWCWFRGEMKLRRVLFSVSTLKFWFTGDGRIWFVSLILLCYMLYPYIYGYIFEKENRTFLRTLVMIGIVVALTVLIMLNEKESYNKIEIAITRLPAFIVGCWMGKLVYEKKEISRWWWIGFLLLAVFSIIFLDKGQVLHGLYKRYFYLVGGIPTAFIFAALAAHAGSVIRKILSFFGNISLELYLSHLMIRGLYASGYLFTYEPGNAKKYLLVLGISVAVAYIGYQAEELLRKVVRVIYREVNI